MDNQATDGGQLFPYTTAQTISLNLTKVDDAINVTVSHFSGGGPRRFLLLHGNPGSMHDMAPLMARLRSEGEVLAYDAPGFGKSPSPKNPYVLTIESSAEIALQVMTHFGWSDAIIVGHSHGGGVAQRVACHWPDRVQALVLLGTLGAAPNLAYRWLSTPGLETLLSLTAKQMPLLPHTILSWFVGQGMRAPYAPTHVTETQLTHEIELLLANPLILRHMAVVTKGKPWLLLKRDASKILAPTVFVHGDQDALVPSRYARALHDLMQGAGREVHFDLVEGAGHMLPLHEPDRCLEAIRRVMPNVG